MGLFGAADFVVGVWFNGDNAETASDSASDAPAACLRFLLYAIFAGELSVSCLGLESRDTWSVSPVCPLLRVFGRGGFPPRPDLRVGTNHSDNDTLMKCFCLSSGRRARLANAQYTKKERKKQRKKVRK